MFEFNICQVIPSVSSVSCKYEYGTDLIYLTKSSALKL
jgi:hypothetical protein